MSTIVTVTALAWVILTTAITIGLCVVLLNRAFSAPKDYRK